jgi:hypothetical protein
MPRHTRALARGICNCGRLRVVKLCRRRNSKSGLRYHASGIGVTGHGNTSGSKRSESTDPNTAPLGVVVIAEG